MLKTRGVPEENVPKGEVGGKADKKILYHQIIPWKRDTHKRLLTPYCGRGNA
jgi:hypothetical protein